MTPPVRPEWPENGEQALYDWLGVPSAAVPDPLLLYEAVRAVAAANGHMPSSLAEWNPRVLAGRRELLDIHREALEDELENGTPIDHTLRPATGDALQALRAMGLEGWET